MRLAWLACCVVGVVPIAHAQELSFQDAVTRAEDGPSVVARREAARAGFRQSWRRTFARESDTLLSPGAALVARGGRILWAYRGEHPGDLPSADNLLAVASEFTTSVRR